MPNDTDESQPQSKTRGGNRPWRTAATPPPPGAPPENPQDSTGERWTVGKLIQWTTDFLKRRGSESPRLDAEVLLAEVLKWQRVQLYTHFEEPVGEEPRARYRDLVRRRAEGVPVAYLVGRKEFYSLPLKVSPAVLIPRPDSEFVVVEFVVVTKTIQAPRCVDVGTGSGCLALACVHEHASARFFASDVSADALAVAQVNAKSLGLDSRVVFRKGSLLEPFEKEAPFDVILSNPPYIPSDVIPTLEVGVRDYEPTCALDGGVDGLRVVADLITEAVPRLKVGGHLILEIGSDQEGPVRELLGARPDVVIAPTIRDHANHPRVLRATKTR